MKSLAYLSILFYLFVFEVVGQDFYQVTRISGGIVFDGKPDDPLWGTIEPLHLTMYTPVFQGEMSEKTEIRFPCRYPEQTQPPSREPSTQTFPYAILYREFFCPLYNPGCESAGYRSGR